MLDYRLWYKLESGTDYTVLSSSLVVSSYTTDFTLLAGQNYQFKVQSKNLVGYSLDSSVLVVRAAKVPDSPTALATTIDFNRHLVIVKWQAPYNGGSSFTAFTVMIQHSDGLNYSQDLANCPGDSATTLA